MPGAPSSPSPRPLPFTARLVQNPMVWAVVMGILFGVPVYRSMTRRLTASPPILGGLPAFTLTDQRGQPFGSRELAGKVWVADFIFTACQAASVTDTPMDTANADISTDLIVISPAATWPTTLTYGAKSSTVTDQFLIYACNPGNGSAVDPPPTTFRYIVFGF